jgi:6-phosphogluconate dehydrogenase
LDAGIVGLGRMGFNMALRLVRAGHRVAAWNRSPGKVDELVSRGAVGAASLEHLVALLPAPRRIWLMLPAGAVTQEHLEYLVPLLSPGDLVVEGGNSFYRDSMARAALLEGKGLRFLDVGTSGGIHGLENGYCLMVGGSADAFSDVEPLLAALAQPGGYLHVGPAGSGHFAKMVHNGIEYALLEAYAEGFELLRSSGFDPDLAALSGLWNHGSVVRSWLLELAEAAFAKDPRLEGLRGFVDDSGEGRWAVSDAVERAVPVPVIALSLMQRFRSRQDDSFGARFIAALRSEFGGHAVEKA